MCAFNNKIARASDTDATRTLLEKKFTKEFFARYSGLLSLSGFPLVIVGNDGRIIYEFVPTPDFCRYVCQKNEGRACEDIMAALENSESSRAEICTCRHGLRSFVVPVKKDGEVIANVIGGFAYVEETAYKKFMIDLSGMAEARGLDIEFVAKTCSSLKEAAKEKAESHMQLCTYIAQSITRTLEDDKIPGNQSVEEEMLEKRIIELESRNGAIMVNPNFLFNTLNCIARIAYFEKASRTEELIYYLSDLLRFNSEQGLVVRNIQAELDSIEKYLAIQKARFQARLQYSIDVPERIRNCRMPNLILGPIVDNALVHGILLKRDGGRISISAEAQGERIIIYVADNGNGFDEEKLRYYKEIGFLGDDESSLCVTNKRIKRYYGEDCGIDVVKSDFSGTTISITINKGLNVR